MNYVSGTEKGFERIQNAPYSVVILTATRGGIAGNVISGFVQANLKAAEPVRHTVYASNSFEHESIRRTIQNIFDAEQLPNVVVTIGTTCTKLFLQKMREEQLDIPVVYAAIAQGDLDDDQDLIADTRYLAGVDIGPADLLDAASLLYRAKPEMKRLLLPRQSHILSRSNHEQASFLIDFFTSRGVEVTPLSVYTTDDVHKAIFRELPKHDTLFLTEGGLSLEHHRSFAYECLHQGVTLFSCSAGTPQFGSVMGYAMSYVPLGKDVFSMVRDVAYSGVEKYKPRIFLHQATRELFVNTALAAGQGIDKERLLKVQSLMDARIYDTAVVLDHINQNHIPHAGKAKGRSVSPF